MKLIIAMLFAITLLLSGCGGGGGSNADTTAPTISSTSPAGNATGVARNATFTATFDEDIFAVSVDTASFTLAKSGSGNTPGTVSFDGLNNVASLTPDNALAILTTYTATLTTDITDLSGNALAADFNWSFTTEDGIWGSATLIEIDNAGSVSSPQIAIGNNDNALAVWQQFDGTRYNIWANRFDGSSWGSATLIETDNAGNAETPQIAIGNNGNALAVWEQYDGTRNNIWNIWANRFE